MDLAGYYKSLKHAQNHYDSSPRRWLVKAPELGTSLIGRYRSHLHITIHGRQAHASFYWSTSFPVLVNIASLQSLHVVIPCGPVVRIRRFHCCDLGSIPHMAAPFFTFIVKILPRVLIFRYLYNPTLMAQFTKFHRNS